MGNEIIIQSKNLSVSYDGIPVLKNLNLKIQKGEFIGILGKSGTGKTSLLNSIAGFINYEGELNVNGNVGFCFQNYSLFPWMTIRKNISFGLRGIGKEEKKIITDELLEKIGLINHAKKYPTALSGGEMQRVSLARALANKPSIILLDEPFSSLDLLTRDQMTSWVLEFIKGYNVTVIMVTHYIDEALLFSDRIFVLKNNVIEHEINIGFHQPRDQQLKFSNEFQDAKQLLIKNLN